MGEKIRLPGGIKVTVEDLETGDEDATTIWDDYVLVCAGDVYLDGIQKYGNGTVVLTLKREDRNQEG